MENQKHLKCSICRVNDDDIFVVKKNNRLFVLRHFLTSWKTRISTAFDLRCMAKHVSHLMPADYTWFLAILTLFLWLFSAFIMHLHEESFLLELFHRRHTKCFFSSNVWFIWKLSLPSERISTFFGNFVSAARNDPRRKKELTCICDSGWQIETYLFVFTFLHKPLHNLAQQT